MSNIKIRELETGLLTNNNDYFAVATAGGDTVKIPYSALVTAILGTSLVQGSNITITDTTSQSGLKQYTISGENGTTWYYGSSQPIGASEGDYWIDTAINDLIVYQYISSVWNNTGMALKGATGQTGATGADGASISAVETPIANGHRVTISSTDPNISDVTFDLTNGTNGADGANGNDGASISFTTVSITGGHSVTISSTDPNVSDQTFNVMDGTEVIQTSSDDRTVTLTTSGWNGVSAPYTQTVTVSGMTASIVPIIGLSISDNSADGIEQKAESTKITKAVSGTDSITFKCYKEKPAVDLTVIIKVV